MSELCEQDYSDEEPIDLTEPWEHESDSEDFFSFQPVESTSTRSEAINIPNLKQEPTLLGPQSPQSVGSYPSLPFSENLFSDLTQQYFTEPQKDLLSLLKSESNTWSDELKLFEQVYGSSLPRFFARSFSDALDKSKKEFKPLLVYLLTNQSDSISAFCWPLGNNVLQSLIEEKFVYFPMVVNQILAQTLNTSFKLVSFPSVVAVAHISGAFNVLEVFHEAEVNDDFLVRLMQIQENSAPLFSKMREKEIEREEERWLKEEQDLAYSLSLQEDIKREQEREKSRLKEEKEREERERREEEERKKAQEIEEQREREERSSINLHLEEKMRRKANLPPEPLDLAADACHVVIRLPNGRRIQRRFNQNNSVQNVYDLIDSSDDYEATKGYIIETHFPTRQYCQKNLSLKEVGLFPKVLLYVVVSS